LTLVTGEKIASIGWSDRIASRLLRFCRHVPRRDDDQLHVEVRVPRGCDELVRIQDLDPRAGLDVGRGHLPLAPHADVRDLLLGTVIQLDAHLLQVEDDIGDVLGHARQGGELVQHAVDTDGDDGCALERRQQHAPERVADGRAVSALERLAEELPERGREALRVGLEPLRLDQLAPVALQHGLGG
jgi:hypothetical protein